MSKTKELQPVIFEGWQQEAFDAFKAGKNPFWRVCAGGGKTFLAGHCIVHNALKYPATTHGIICKDYPLAYKHYFAKGGDTIRQYCQEQFGDAVEINETGMFIRFKHNNSIIYLLTADETKITGLTLKTTFFDESAKIPNLMPLFQEAIARRRPKIGAKDKSLGQIGVISSPLHENDFYQIEQIARANPQEWDFRHVTGYNARVHPPEVAKEIYDSMKRDTPATWERDALALYTNANGRAINEFKEGVHTSYDAEYNPGYDIEHMMDFNGGKFITLQGQLINGVLNIFDETVVEATAGNKVQTEDVCKLIAKKYKDHDKNHNLCPDSTWNKTTTTSRYTDEMVCKKALNYDGHTKLFNIPNRIIKNNSDDDGVKQLNSLFANHKILIHPKCDELIKTLNTIEATENSKGMLVVESTRKSRGRDGFFDVLKYFAHRNMRVKPKYNGRPVTIYRNQM